MNVKGAKCQGGNLVLCMYVGWMDVGLLSVGWMNVLEPYAGPHRTTIQSGIFTSGTTCFFRGNLHTKQF